MKEVNDYFPTVGVVAPSHMADLFTAPAHNLGINLLTHSSNELHLESLVTFAKQCDVITIFGPDIPLSTIKSLESQGHRVYPSSESLARIVRATKSASSTSELTVLIARSAHGQATSWVPTQIKSEARDTVMTISPAAEIASDELVSFQERALQVAQEMAIIGVASISIDSNEDICGVEAGPGISGLWTVGGALTDQFEQHLRAILDLPLGDPSISNRSGRDTYTVMSTFIYGSKSDMYRPYLHLMARSPQMKFHQYRGASTTAGHLSLSGDDLGSLIHECEHARDYMSGEVDE